MVISGVVGPRGDGYVAAGLPVGIMFTVETDVALPDGTTLGNAIEAVDASGEVAYLGINCAHPDHITPALTGGAWVERVAEIKPNASTKSHAELDAAEDLYEGDIAALARAVRDLRPKLPNLSIPGERSRPSTQRSTT